jgi:hypothetical protein
MDLARAPRRARSNTRKKGSGYENETNHEIDYIIIHVFSSHNGTRKLKRLSIYTLNRNFSSRCNMQLQKRQL